MTERIPSSPQGEDLDQFAEELAEFTEDEVDVLVWRLLSEPARHHILLLATAYQLEIGQPTQRLTPRVLTEAMNEARDEILDGLPTVVASEAAMNAVAALPPEHPGDTAGVYAVRIRLAASQL